jgi:sarcosine reductase
MSLELGTFPVNDAVLGTQTRWHGGVLELDLEELQALVREDPLLKDSRLELAKPGESARISSYEDVVEPRVKVSGPGTVYPGVWGRSSEKVGTGRTHRLSGFAVMECLDMSHLSNTEQLWPSLKMNEHPAAWERFVDMSGPNAERPPFGGLNLLCLVVRAAEGATGEERRSSMHAATMRLSDRLAATTLDIDPPEMETFDLTPRSGLPNIAFVPHLASSEWTFGSRSPLGTSVYGMSRLNYPWMLDPTEVLDGAIYTGGAAGTTWMMVNNPVVLNACRMHGRDVNFKTCVVQRTNWTKEAEKQLMADRLAHALKMADIQGAVITNDVRGQRFLEAILSVQACEREGVKVVLLTEEEDSESGTAPPLLVSVPELKAAVSAGTGATLHPFDGVQRSIGGFDTTQESNMGEIPAIHGRYGTSHFNDIFGYDTQSYDSY